MCDVSIWQKIWVSTRQIGVQLRDKESPETPPQSPLDDLASAWWAKAWHQNLKQPCLYLTLQNVPKKNSVSSSETSNHGGLRNSFYSLDVFQFASAFALSSGLFGDSALSWIDQNVQWPTARCTRSIFKASKRRLVCGTPLLCLQTAATFWGWKSDS